VCGCVATFRSVPSAATLREISAFIVIVLLCAFVIVCKCGLFLCLLCYVSFGAF
jgi:hypothetical protein